MLASTGLCPAVPGPDIIVSLQRDDVEIRNDLTRAQLLEMRDDIDLAYRVHDPAHDEIGGMLRGDIAVQYRISFDRVPANDGHLVCARYRTIHVILAVNPVIFVAHEYAPPGCMYREIYSHEEMHLAVDKSVIEKYAQRMRDGLEMAFSLPGDGVAGPVPQQDLPVLEENMGRDVMGIANVLVQDMARERAERQKAVDAPENYVQVMRRCYFELAPLR